MRTEDRIRKSISNIVGYLCVFMFFSLTSYIVYIFYSIIAPAILKHQAYGKFLFHFIFGNWLALNIYFNYIMTWLTSPGLSKNYQNLSMQYPICKKCSFGRAPRTHHCDWCDLCILRYDRHCPWMNNCIGFYNHRYFYQFCCFMSLGCLYAGLFGYREYQISLFHIQFFQHIDSFFMADDIHQTMGTSGFITYYIFIIALTAGFLLLGLSWRQGRMISRGETSAERLITQDYEIGFNVVPIRNVNLVDNWKRFFGVRNMREFIRRILLPSTHQPRGNGITMDSYDINTDLKFQRRNSDQLKQYTTNVPNGYYSIPEGYLVNKYRSDSPSWQKESVSISFKACYNPRTSSTDWKSDGYLNDV